MYMVHEEIQKSLPIERTDLKNGREDKRKKEQASEQTTRKITEYKFRPEHVENVNTVNIGNLATAKNMVVG